MVESLNPISDNNTQLKSLIENYKAKYKDTIKSYYYDYYKIDHFNGQELLDHALCLRTYNDSNKIEAINDLVEIAIKTGAKASHLKYVPEYLSITNIKSLLESELNPNIVLDIFRSIPSYKNENLNQKRVELLELAF
jgi:hypothetical protein